ncbi:unnamed protein product [Cuscuta campestris]|uniref:Glutaredoxin domain-containing protein n=1 Tax=Cuscuta campestris TaxID=132261 RepID=A0A484MKF2_9ASTE|nr:unnamed protein product [Cuscuta campestris]
MATISFSSPAAASPRSSISSPSVCFSHNASTLSFHSLPKSSPIFTSVTLRPINRTKPRLLNVSVFVANKLSETDSVSVPSEQGAIDAVFPKASGVYAVYDSNGDLQFIGISRNLAASVLSHKISLPDLCSSVKFDVVDDPDKTALTQSWRSWIEEHIAVTGKVPPGNDSGNTTWIHQQPKKKKTDLRLTPGRRVQLTVPLEDLIDRLVKENKVVAFIKGSRNAPLCGFSQRVVAILESQGVDYESIDVLDEEHNNGLRETLKRYSNWPTFPQVFVNGELVGGCDILMSMYEKGEIASLLKS